MIAPLTIGVAIAALLWLATRNPHRSRGRRRPGSGDAGFTDWSNGDSSGDAGDCGAGDGGDCGGD